MEIQGDRKPDILLAVLQERYAASHAMRARGMQFTLWISGLALGLAWLLISQAPMSKPQCVALTGLIVILFAGTIYFIAALRRGFQNNRDALISAEQALGLHEPGVYLEGAALLPKEYASAQPKWSDHFCSLCVWIVLLGLSLLALTWTSPSHGKAKAPTSTVLQKQGGK